MIQFVVIVTITTGIKWKQFCQMKSKCIGN